MAKHYRIDLSPGPIRSLSSNWQLDHQYVTDIQASDSNMWILSLDADFMRFFWAWGAFLSFSNVVYVHTLSISIYPSIYIYPRFLLGKNPPKWEASFQNWALRHETDSSVSQQILRSDLIIPATQLLTTKSASVRPCHDSSWWILHVCPSLKEASVASLSYFSPYGVTF